MTARKRWENTVAGAGGQLSTVGLLGGTALGAAKSIGALRKGDFSQAGKTLATIAGNGWLAGSLAGAAHGASKKVAKLEGKTVFQGFPISVEKEKGSIRTWKAEDGSVGETKMLHPYGYIRGTKGTDGDHVDVYVGPDEKAPNVYIVNQAVKNDWKTFDEQKVMLGFNNSLAAKKAYLAHYNDPRFLLSIKAMPVEEFRQKVMDKEMHGEKLAGLFSSMAKRITSLRKPAQNLASKGVAPAPAAAAKAATPPKAPGAFKKKAIKAGLVGAGALAVAGGATTAGGAALVQRSTRYKPYVATRVTGPGRVY